MNHSLALVMGLVTLLSSTSAAYADVGLAGITFSAGLEDHEISDRPLNGVVLRMRTFKAFDTLPLLVTALDLKYGNSTLELSGDDHSVTTTGVGILVGTAIPVQLLGVKLPAGTPKGVGPQIYTVWNIDRVNFVDGDDDDSVFGGSVDLGFQAGYPITDSFVIAVRAEYTHFFLPNDEIAGIPGDNLTRNGFAYSLVFGFPIFNR